MNTPMHYDAIVVGAGQAGGPLSTALARSGRRTLLVEREHVGGTCINEGCTPTKTMVASARVAYLARRGADYGVETGPVRLNLAKVRERKRAIVESFRSGSERRIEATEGLELVFGEARFVGPRTLAVGDRTVTADLVFINIGCRPAPPDIPGLDQVGALDSTSIMELDAVPEHLMVLGGGYIGIEFAQMFRRFGSKVTVIQRGAQLLPQEDDDIAGAVLEILREDGVEVVLEAQARCAERADDTHVRVVIHGSGGDRAIVGTHVLAATGRIPNTDRLSPKAAGIETDARGFMRVNERLETTAAGVYALGDVKGGPAFTHISYDDYRIIRANLLEGGHRTTDRPAGALYRLHGSAARPRRTHRAGAEEAGPGLPGGVPTDESRGAGAGAGRIAWNDEDPGGSRDAPSAWGGDSWHRGRGDDGGAPTRHDGKRAV